MCYLSISILQADCFNRTFMELKQAIDIAPKPIKLGFNRTFMELKYELLHADITDEDVLIVPLWN